MRLLQVLFLLVSAAPVWAAGVHPDLLARIRGADVVILGEVHDNPTHHQNQHEILKALPPKAVVWEMLTPEEAGRISPELLHAPDRLDAVLDWSRSGWPAFSIYWPVFSAAPDARLFGGELPRDAVIAAIQSGPAQVFGDDAARYGLTEPLPEAEAQARKALQYAAHCEAVPMDRMQAMVDIQRLRDAVLARAVITALAETGGPVAVITGNGHARRDWGIPVYLDRVQPGLTVFALGQSEGGDIAGEFDAVIDSAPPAREDPCNAFRTEG